jgi:hypothetical protein
MKADDVVAIVGMIIMFVFGFGLGGCAGTQVEQENAIKAGVAEYYIDADNDKAFRYKGAK